MEQPRRKGAFRARGTMTADAALPVLDIATGA